MGLALPKVCVIGLGFVGLSTAVCFASKGVKTTGLDIDSDRVRTIEEGKVPFHEPFVDRLLQKSTRSHALKLTTSYEEGVTESEIVFVTVGTPSAPDGSADMTYVEEASKSIGLALRKANGWRLVVVKSTVPAGTTDGLVRPTIQSQANGISFGIASNPEFLKEGSAVKDTLHPDRLVIGSSEPRSGNKLRAFYRSFYGRRMPPVISTNCVNAELIKYASNSFLATKITFINEVANLCASIPGGDIATVATGMGLDPRIGHRFLKAGLGFGGSCFPKDLRALIQSASQVGVTLKVAAAAESGNDEQFRVAVRLAEKLVGDLKDKRIALLGLAFKPDSDDMREAVSLKLIAELEKIGASIVAYDPASMQNARRILGDKIEYSSSALDCLKGADCCIVITEWREFSRLRPSSFRRLMKTPAVVDGRRAFNQKLFLKAGVKFAAVGIASSEPSQEEVRALS